jgi:hypothetical protein
MDQKGQTVEQRIVKSAPFKGTLSSKVVKEAVVKVVEERTGPKRAKYTQRHDGEGFEVPSGELYRLACCDCGLVHDFIFMSHDGLPIGIATKRNKGSTAQRRLHHHSKAHISTALELASALLLESATPYDQACSLLLEVIDQLKSQTEPKPPERTNE